MNKVGIIAILAFSAVLLLCCFAVHSYYKSEDNKHAFDLKVEDFRSRKAYFSDFVKRVDGENVWMDSDKAKVSVKIPREWEAFEGSFSAISMKSKDFVPLDNDAKKAPFPSAGCWIDFNVQIDKKEEGYKNFVKETLNNPDYFSKDDLSEQKIVIGNLEALAIISEQDSKKGRAFFVKIPNNNFTYKIDSYFFGKNKEECEKEFDDFLNSMVIK